MKPFSNVRGQEQAVAFLGAAVESGRLAHAYLLAGPEGTGRLTVALDMAASWICPEVDRGFCGECTHCRRIFSFDHPDVRLTIPQTSSVTPEQVMDLILARRADGETPLRFEGNTSIRIGQVRELGQRMMLRPFEGLGRVEIILDSDRMMPQAANAMLKTLEEPPDTTLIMLLTSFYSRILPTIRSRAHLVRLCRLPVAAIRDELAARKGLDSEEATALARASDGSLGRALLLAGSDPSTESPVETVFPELSACSTCSEVSGLSSAMSKKLGREGLLMLCRGIRSGVHDMRRSLAGREPLGPDPGAITGVQGDDGLEEIVHAFSECESMLSRNVMPSMALNAALIGSWKVLGNSGARR